MTYADDSPVPRGGRCAPAADASADDVAARKRAWRRAAYARRRACDDTRRALAGERCARLLAAHHRLEGATRVACYASMGTEIDTRPMLRMLVDRGVRVLVPRLGRGMDIGWSELDARAVRLLRHPPRPTRGALRPDEPDAPTLGADALAGCDVVVLPALAVDAEGFRLGRGGGWYDRALAHARPDAYRLAVCWPWEATDGTVPHEGHDEPVDAVLTPDAIRGLGAARIAGRPRPPRGTLGTPGIRI